MDTEKQVLAVLNSKPGTKFIEKDKQDFTIALTELHNTGYYVIYSKADGKAVLSNKKPETLARQIEQREVLIEGLFERIR